MAEKTVESQDLPIQIISQYVRDMSFENPRAPDSILAAKGKPELDVNIGFDARQLPDQKGVYEAIVNVRAEATQGGEPAFLCELLYGVLAEIDPSISEDNHHPMVYIELPRLAFPFIRQIVANAVASGGFPPLYLSPVDFHQLYVQRFSEELKASQTEKTAKENV